MNKYLLIGFSVLSLSGVAMASDAAKKDAGQGFAALDADKSGMLSKEEVAGNAVATKNFASLDADKDGSLSHAEFDTLSALTQAD